MTMKYGCIALLSVSGGASAFTSGIFRKASTSSRTTRYAAPIPSFGGDNMTMANVPDPAIIYQQTQQNAAMDTPASSLLKESSITEKVQAEEIATELYQESAIAPSDTPFDIDTHTAATAGGFAFGNIFGRLLVEPGHDPAISALVTGCVFGGAVWAAIEFDSPVKGLLPSSLREKPLGLSKSGLNAVQPFIKSATSTVQEISERFLSEINDKYEEIQEVEANVIMAISNGMKNNNKTDSDETNETDRIAAMTVKALEKIDQIIPASEQDTPTLEEEKPSLNVYGSAKDEFAAESKQVLQGTAEEEAQHKLANQLCDSVEKTQNQASEVPDAAQQKLQEMQEQATAFFLNKAKEAPTHAIRDTKADTIQSKKGNNDSIVAGTQVLEQHEDEVAEDQVEINIKKSDLLDDLIRYFTAPGLNVGRSSTTEENSDEEDAVEEMDEEIVAFGKKADQFMKLFQVGSKEIDDDLSAKPAAEKGNPPKDLTAAFFPSFEALTKSAPKIRDSEKANKTVKNTPPTFLSSFGTLPKSGARDKKSRLAAEEPATTSFFDNLGILSSKIAKENTDSPRFSVGRNTRTKDAEKEQKKHELPSFDFFSSISPSIPEKETQEKKEKLGPSFNLFPHKSAPIVTTKAKNVVNTKTKAPMKKTTSTTFENFFIKEAALSEAQLSDKETVDAEKHESIGWLGFLGHTPKQDEKLDVAEPEDPKRKPEMLSSFKFSGFGVPIAESKKAVDDGLKTAATTSSTTQPGVKNPFSHSGPWTSVPLSPKRKSQTISVVDGMTREQKKVAQEHRRMREEKARIAATRREAKEVFKLIAKKTVSLEQKAGGRSLLVAEQKKGKPVTTSPKKKVMMEKAPRGVATLTNWKRGRDGSVSGNITGSNKYDPDEYVTTSKIIGKVMPGTVVKTASGSEYFLAPEQNSKGNLKP